MKNRFSFKKILALAMALFICIGFMPDTGYAAEQPAAATQENADLLTFKFGNTITKISESDWDNESAFERISAQKYRKYTYSFDITEECLGITLESLLVYVINCDADALLDEYGDYQLTFDTSTNTVGTNSSSFTISNLLSERYYFENAQTASGAKVKPILVLSDGALSMKFGQKDVNETNGSYWIDNITCINIIAPGSDANKNIDADYAKADTAWYDSGLTSYSISSALQLLGLAKLVNENGVDFANKTVALSSDIDMEEMAWTPIGTASNPFKGTFDGSGKTVTGLKTVRTRDYNGLFGLNLGSIKNFTIAGKVLANGEIDYVGGVAGFNAGEISGVVSSVVVKAPNSFNVGGICGMNTSGTYVEKNSAGDDETKTITGAAGENSGKISCCANKAEIRGWTKVGGIAGENAGNISQCFNIAAIKGMNNSSKNGVGGIVGRNGNNNTAVETGQVARCFNTGAIGIEGQKWTGGIAGFNNGLSGNSYCYNIGSIVSTTGYDNPIAGNQEGTVANTHDNYSIEGLNHTGTSESEIGTVVSSDELKSQGTIEALNDGLQQGCFMMPVQSGAAGNEDSGDLTNGGYPVLSWYTGDYMAIVATDDPEPAPDPSPDPDPDPVITYEVGKIELSAKSFTYNGKTRKPSVSIKNIQGEDIPSSEYTITNNGGKSVGTYSVKIVFKNNYAAAEDWKGTYVINPKGTSIKKLSKAKKAFTVKWAKQTGKMSSARATGYQLRYSLKSSMGSAKTVTVKGYKSASRKIKKLAAKKKYYVQIRTYMKVGSKTYYSGWSGKKSVKTR